MSDIRLRITTAGNTIIPTLQAIVAKGYTVSLLPLSRQDSDPIDRYQAMKDGRSFVAESPEELLGLIAMWEVRGDDWQLKDGEIELWEQVVKIGG